MDQQNCVLPGTPLAPWSAMTMRDQALRYGQRRLRRRIGRSLPWIGAIFAIATIGGAIRRKGLFGGTLNTALDAIPFVGGAKNLAEVYRGRDFIRDKRVTVPAAR
jgi:hypothetical protein